MSRYGTGGTSKVTDQHPLYAEEMEHAAGKRFGEHAHDSGQLTVVIKGTMTVSTPAGWWLIPPGFAFWVPPATPHVSFYSETSSVINCWLTESVAADWPLDCIPIVVTDLLYELVREAVRGTHTEMYDAERITASKVLPLIACLMAYQLASSHRQPQLFIPQGRDRRLRQAIMILHETLGVGITIEILAKQVNSSDRTLTRLFVAETGMTFHKWLERLRLVYAVDKMSRGSSIIATTA